VIHHLSQLILEAAKGGGWEEVVSPLNVLRYITVRTAGAALTSFMLSLWLGPKVILWLKKLKFGQNYADKAEESGEFQNRLCKKGTPTMGGLLIVLALDISALIWARPNTLVLLTLLSVVGLAALGFYDDFVKITQQSGKGATSRVKLVVQFGLAFFIGIYLWSNVSTRPLITDIMVPFYKFPILTGATVTGILLAVLTIVGSSNAVNLTDGLDGLATGCTLLVSVVFLVLTYVAGNVNWAEYLQIPYVAGAGELTVFCGAMLGAGLGFLWFNCHPAQMFMGDTGSLALGGALGIIAVLIHQPFVLFIAGGVFVSEAVSVMLQTGWFKYTRKRFGEGRRIFLMAPLHHHFEKKGWYESQVVTRFYIVGVLFAVVALSTLKIR